jgi:hypothetical protein
MGDLRTTVSADGASFRDGLNRAKGEAQKFTNDLEAMSARSLDKTGRAAADYGKRYAGLAQKGVAVGNVATQIGGFASPQAAAAINATATAYIGLREAAMGLGMGMLKLGGIVARIDVEEGARVLPRVRGFVFSSRIGDVTALFAAEEPEVAIELAMKRWGYGSTDYGTALRGLLEAGVIELDLTAVVGHEVNNGNLLGLVSSYKGADGQDHAMADVWFAKAQPGTEAPPALSELLVADTGNLLGGAPAAEATRTSVGHHGTVLMSRLPGISDDELLRQQQPLL